MLHVRHIRSPLFTGLLILVVCPLDTEGDGHYGLLEPQADVTFVLTNTITIPAYFPPKSTAHDAHSGVLKGVNPADPTAM